LSTEPATEIAVHRTITVPLGQGRAFELFTARMGEFWPREHSIGQSAIADVVVEPRAGGRWFERGVDGSECDWGRVDEFDPPGRVVLVWQISADWAFDPSLVTEVEVTFIEHTPGSTTLDLRHRHLERYGDRAEVMRALFASPEAWDGTLAEFADVAS
jgi:uncharacterized protein YndB with AHSA1/START domain